MKYDVEYLCKDIERNLNEANTKSFLWNWLEKFLINFT